MTKEDWTFHAHESLRGFLDFLPIYCEPKTNKVEIGSPHTRMIQQPLLNTEKQFKLQLKSWNEPVSPCDESPTSGGLRFPTSRAGSEAILQQVIANGSPLNRSFSSPHDVEAADKIFSQAENAPERSAAQPLSQRNSKPELTQQKLERAVSEGEQFGRSQSGGSSSRKARPPALNIAPVTN